MSRDTWDPMQELVSVHKRMNQLFERALARANFDAQEGVGSWTPEADVFETATSFVVDLELPGLSQDAIELRVDGDELVIEGERRREGGGDATRFHRVERSHGKFSRRIRIPSTADRGSIEARYRNGVLRVALSKQDRQEPQAIKVPIS